MNKHVMKMFKTKVCYFGCNSLLQLSFFIKSTARNKPYQRSVNFELLGYDHLKIDEIRRYNSTGHGVRKFFEYQDVSEEDNGAAKIPYTIWEGNENRHSHSSMVNNNRYSTTIAKTPSNNGNDKLSPKDIDDMLSKNYRHEPVALILNNFRQVSHYASANGENIHSRKYENLLKALISNCKIFTNSQISNVLESLSLWLIEANDAHFAYSKLYTALDAECVNRMNNLSTDDLLFITDHWYKLRLIKRSRFVRNTFIKLGKNPKTLSLENLVQLMFYAGVSRSTLIDFRKVEIGLKKHIGSLSVDEIAVVCLAFFKCQVQIRDRKTLAAMINKTIKEIDSINEFSFAAVLKAVRYSIHLDDLQFLSKLLESTIPQIPRLSAACLVHVILAAANKGLFYAELLNAVTSRFGNEISKLRLKDIRCLVFALSSFNYVPEREPSIFDRIIDELNDTNRQSELREYPESFVSCVHHLGILNVYPEQLIARALDPRTIKKTYRNNLDAIKHEIFALDLNIETEIPDYRGPRLDAKIRQNRLTDIEQSPKSNQTSAANYFMLDVVRACEKYVGSKKIIHVDYVLPQYDRPDIFICLDDKNNPIPLSHLLSRLPFGTVKHPPKLDFSKTVKWLALIIGSYNSYAKNTKRLLGHMSAKQRQLEYIGYTPCLIFWQDWKQLGNDEQKLEYLRCKVFQS